MLSSPMVGPSSGTSFRSQATVLSTLAEHRNDKGPLPPGPPRADSARPATVRPLPPLGARPGPWLDATEGSPGRRYFVVTALVADPHKVLRTVMFFGFASPVNCPEYLPSPRFLNVPISVPVSVT